MISEKLVPRKHVVLVTNTAFSVVNFRKELIINLAKEFNVHVIAMGPMCGFQSVFSSNVNLVCVNTNGPFNASKSNILTQLVFVWRCCLMIAKIRPHFVLSFTLVPNLISNFLKHFLDFTLITNITGFGRACTRRKSSRLMKFIFGIYVYLLKNTDHILVQNRRDETFISKKHSTHRSVTRLVGSGVELNSFPPVLRDSYSKVLFASRLLPEKGIIDFLYIAEAIHAERGPKLEFSVAGSGDRELETKVILNSHIKYFGHVKDISNLLRQHDILLFCSIYDEGTPKSVLEALCSGMIVVCRRNAYTRDLLQLGFKIYIFDELNDAVLHVRHASQLRPPELEDIFTHNQALAKQHLDVSIVCDKYLQLMTA